VLATNRGHWSIENSCHYIIDWNYDEDRSRIRAGNGPENITRLRRFAISIIKLKGARSVAQEMRQLSRNVRLVLGACRVSQYRGRVSSNIDETMLRDVTIRNIVA